MKNINKLLVGLAALASGVMAQKPIASGRYLVFNKPSSLSTELFWDVSGGNTNPPVPEKTPIIAQFLGQLPPSLPNQQWMVNFLSGLGGSSGRYSFNSALASNDLFGLTAAGGAIVSRTQALFNVTAVGSGLFTIQLVNSNMAITSNVALTQQITMKPLVAGNVLQRWGFFLITA